MSRTTGSPDKYLEQVERSLSSWTSTQPMVSLLVSSFVKVVTGHFVHWLAQSAPAVGSQSLTNTKNCSPKWPEQYSRIESSPASPRLLRCAAYLWSASGSRAKAQSVDGSFALTMNGHSGLKRSCSLSLITGLVLSKIVQFPLPDL